MMVGLRTSATGVPITVDVRIGHVAEILRTSASGHLADPLDAAAALFDAAATVLSARYAPATVAAMLKAIGTLAGEKAVNGRDGPT